MMSAAKRLSPSAQAFRDFVVRQGRTVLTEISADRYPQARAAEAACGR